MPWGHQRLQAWLHKPLTQDAPSNMLAHVGQKRIIALLPLAGADSHPQPGAAAPRQEGVFRSAAQHRKRTNILYACGDRAPCLWRRL